MKEDFNKFIKTYEMNKNIIKNNSYKTIEQFMSLFKNPSFIKLNSNNELDFLIDNNIIFKFVEENNTLENIEKEFLILIYISQKENVPESFYSKLLLSLIDNFSPTQIFMNIKFFKKCLKFILKNLKHNIIIEIINKSINDNKELEINNKNKSNIIIFLYYYYLYNINNEINNDNIDINNNNFNYIKIIFDLNKILNLYLTKESDYISC